MFNSSCIKRFFLIIVCSVSITNLYAEPNNQEIDNLLSQISPEQLAQFQEALQSEIDKMLPQRLNLLNTIDRIHENLCIEITRNTIQTKNQKETIQNISTWRKAINAFKSCTLMQVDLYTLHVLDRFIHAAAKTLYLAINNGMDTFPKFDEQLIKTRKPQDITDFEQIQQEAADNQELLDMVASISDKVGLTWYNKAYRKLDDWMIEPALKYSVPSRAMKVALLAAAPLYIGYRYGHPWCKKIFGPAFKSNVYRSDIERRQLLESLIPYIKEDQLVDAAQIIGDDPDRNLGPLGKTDRFLHDFATGTMALGILCWPIIKTFWQEELSFIHKKIKKQVLIAHNKLKGGVYRKKAQDLEDIIPDVTFEDVIGLEHAKECLKLLIKYIENPDKFDRGDLVPQKGYLLTGPTRTGKSFLAKALCGEVKKATQEREDNEFKFMEIHASTINEMGIREVLKIAKYAAPCIIFIDEIGLLNLQRTSDTKTLCEFLNALSGALDNDPKKQVIIIATTNQPQNLDDALRQPGRFGKELRFEYPGISHRKEFFVRRLSKLAIDPSYFDLNKLAFETEGCSYEALELLLSGALQKALVKGVVLSQELLEQSLDEEIRHIMINDGKEISQTEAQIIAAQQTGFSMAHLLLDTTAKVAKVTIKPIIIKHKEQLVGMELYNNLPPQDESGKEYGRVFVYHEQDTNNFSTREQRIIEIKLKLAGNIAENLLLGSCGFTYKSNSKKEAYELACNLILEGIEVKALSKHTKQELLDQAYQLVKTCEQEMQDLFTQHTEKLQALMNALLEKQTLTAQEVYTTIGLKIETNHAAENQAIQDLGIPEESAAA